MIPRDHITEWRANAPWITDRQVEQDLVISRALVELFSQPAVASALAFRGGTALYKLHFRPAARYSEDIDLVQTSAVPIGPVLDAIHGALDHWLGKPQWKQTEGRVTLGYRFDSEDLPPTRLKLKRARKIISAAGALTTVKRLLPEAERGRPWARSIAALKPSPCHVCLYLGFKGDIRKAGATPANKWFYETWSTERPEWDVADPTSRAPCLYTSFPSLKDPSHDPGPDELHTGEVVTFVPYDFFEKWADARWKRRGEDYDALKRDLTERLRAQFLEHMPALAPLLAFAELSTPLSTEHFTRAPSGAIYGIEPTPERYRNPYLRPRTPVRDLYLSGSDMALVGVMGAFVGGVLCAIAAEPVRALPWLRDASRVG